jgi:hypothetical protein
VGAIASALEAMARDRDLGVRMGAAGRDKVLREFNQHASARTLVELFAGGPLTPGAPADARVGQPAPFDASDQFAHGSARVRVMP